MAGSRTIAEQGTVYNMLETDKSPNSKAVLYTPYLRAREQCVQMYYLIHGDQTALTVNIIEERSRKRQEVWLVWVQKLQQMFAIRYDECTFQNSKYVLNRLDWYYYRLHCFSKQLFKVVGGQRDGKWRRLFKELASINSPIVQVEIAGKRGRGNSGVIIDDLTIQKCSHFRMCERHYTF